MQVIKVIEDVDIVKQILHTVIDLWLIYIYMLIEVAQFKAYTNAYSR